MNNSVWVWCEKLISAEHTSPTLNLDFPLYAFGKNRLFKQDWENTLFIWISQRKKSFPQSAEPDESRSQIFWLRWKTLVDLTSQNSILEYPIKVIRKNSEFKIGIQTRYTIGLTRSRLS